MDELLKTAKSIFGEQVEKVWMPIEGKKPNIEGGVTIEPVDGYPVRVKFKNGKVFEIWASEWGGVTLVEEEKENESI